MLPLTDLNFLKPGEDWPPRSQRERLDNYHAHRLLFEGAHEKVFKDSWLRLLRQDEAFSLEMVLNWPKRLSTLWADLLVGDPPGFTVGEKGSPEQTQVDSIVRRNQFTTLCYDVIIDISRYGDGLFKLALKDGESYICGQSPAYWYPVVSIADLRDIKYQVLAWPFMDTARAGRLKGSELDMLKVEVHEKGQIQHIVLALNKQRRIENTEPVEAHFPEITDPVEDTGIDDFLVQQAPGLRTIDRFFGVDDYADLESVVQEMEVRLAQIARILDQHADPTMYGSEAAVDIDPLTGMQRFSTGKFFPVADDETPPAYMTWDGQLAANFQELEELKNQFYLITETSPAAFGSLEVGTVTSGTALRRLMQAPLAKARRMRMRLDPVVRKVLQIAVDLETQGGNVNNPVAEDASA